MIVVDSSALMAVILDEPVAEACGGVLTDTPRLLISAGTLTEALIVAAGRGRRAELEALIAGLPFEVVPVEEADAFRAADAHARWGKGRHPAGLNFGDCFAYALAAQQGLPLLFTGNDFARTDIRPALPQHP